MAELGVPGVYVDQVFTAGEAQQEPALLLAAEPALPDTRDKVVRQVVGQPVRRLGDDLAEYAARRLRERGIELRATTRLESAEDGRIRLSDGEAFEADTLVWTAGVKASPLPVESGLPVDARVLRYKKSDFDLAWSSSF